LTALVTVFSSLCTSAAGEAVASSAPPFSAPPPPLPFTLPSSRTYSCSPDVRGRNDTCITTASRAGSVTYRVTIEYRPFLAVLVTSHAMPVPSSARTV
jgi:hypothetical protein